MAPTFSLTITDPDQGFLSAVKQKLGCGTVGKEYNSAFQYRIQNKKDIVDIMLPILSNGYLPAGRQKALDTFSKAYLLSLSNDINTPKGWREFVELTYNLNVSGLRRKQSMQDIISYGENFFSSN